MPGDADVDAGAAGQVCGAGWPCPSGSPGPGASLVRAKAEPTMTPSEPQAMALQMSPPVDMPPSVMIGT